MINVAMLAIGSFSWTPRQAPRNETGTIPTTRVSDEAPKLIEDEADGVEEAAPAEENEGIERDDENKKPEPPAFEN